MRKVQMNTLVRKIAKREGKRIEVSAGNIREILRVLQDMIGEEVLLRGYSRILHLLYVSPYLKLEKAKKRGRR
jgi:hypothetical protein